MFDPDNIDSLLGEFMVFKKRIDDRISLLINLDERGKLLLQGGEEQDCVKLEEELNDFHEYCLQVFIRLDRYYRRLLRVSDDSEYKNSLYHDMEMQELSWWAGGSSEVLDLPGDSPSPELTSSRKSKKQNGRLTPGSMGSLEWDDYDMSRSEIETKIANGEMTDDDSIPELSPFETRDTTIPVKQSPLSSANTSQQIDKTSKRSNAVDIRDLDTDTRHKKPRTSEKMSETQRQQLNNDLEDVLSWLINVKCDVTENGDYITIRDLEQKLSDLKDLQKQIEVRKPIVLSINLVTSPYSTSEEDGDELKTKLRRMNEGWEEVEKSVLDWKRSLQRCFVRSKAFRSDVQKIQERVKDLSRRRDDLVAVVKTWESPLSAPFSTLRKTHRDLVQIRIEILEDRAQVASLQDVSNLLFVDARYRATSSPPVDGAAEACDKLNDLGASLRSLLDRVADDIQVAETALQRERHRARDEVSSTSDVDSIASETSLHSSTPIKLKMLRRKVETNEAESSEKENSKDNAAVTDQASDADVTMPLPLATKYRTVTDYTEPDIHVLCKHTSIKSSTENIFLTTTNETVDSDVESGYVEYDVECELQVVRNAVNTAFQTTTVDAAPVGIIPTKNGQSFKPHSGFVAKQDIKAKSDLFSRGIKASIPFFLFFLFLYFILWLISASCISDDRTICLQRNNLHYSLSPMLTWTDGPPPT